MSIEASLIMGPAVGAVVGYCTNFIAVKMMFRPLKEVRIFGKRVPFTPGIIPKEKNRITEKIANTISEKLLTPEFIAENIVDDTMRDGFCKKVCEYYKSLYENNKNISYYIASFTEDETDYVDRVIKFKIMISEYFSDRIKAMDPGEKIVDEARKAVKEKISGSFIAMMINDELIDSLLAGFKGRLNNYIDENLKTILYESVSEEIDKLLSIKMSDAAHMLNISEKNIYNIAGFVFDKVFISEITQWISKIDIAGMVSSRMDEMDVLEIEEVLLSIMKKELNYVVNLGAVIGFAIGILSTLPSL